MLLLSVGTMLIEQQDACHENLTNVFIARPKTSLFHIATAGNRIRQILQIPLLER
jgi:hypothetical protein